MTYSKPINPKISINDVSSLRILTGKNVQLNKTPALIKSTNLGI